MVIRDVKIGFILVSLLFTLVSQAKLVIEITEGTASAIPLAAVPFGYDMPEPPPVDVSAVINADLTNSGRFELLASSALISFPHVKEEVNFSDWRLLRTEGLLIGQIKQMPTGQYDVQFQLFDVYKEQQLVGKRYQVPAIALRRVAHKIADQVYEALTGEVGAFSTRLAFISALKTAQGKSQYILQISDSDGANPRTILQSNSAILSPSWSPDGEKLSYVSFENGQSEIYIQSVRTGERIRLAKFRGLNSAPSWSPDGQRMAMTLSKNGNAEIYIMTIADQQLTRVTHRSNAIDTSATWLPDGKSIIFTSDRGGKPQIYQIAASGGKAKRLTFEGDYNASPDISPDGRYMTMVHGVKGRFYIAIQELKTGYLQVLTEQGQDESPSFSPAGDMILYATKIDNKGLLAAVSTDGSIHKRLSQSTADVREPAWSPIRQ